MKIQSRSMLKRVLTQTGQPEWDKAICHGCGIKIIEANLLGEIWVTHFFDKPSGETWYRFYCTKCTRRLDHEEDQN